LDYNNRQFSFDVKTIKLIAQSLPMSPEPNNGVHVLADVACCGEVGTRVNQQPQ
jgi:hypothetical protein